MSKRLFILLFFSLSIGACSSSKKVVKTSVKTSSKADKIIGNALQFKGVKYKFGGTTKKGVDCSGIIYVAFQKENISLPRVSREMAKMGKKISLGQAKKGDLLFFKTSKSGRSINHVGLIISVNKGQTRFVHSTSSKGVIISLISEKYWRNAFVKAVKIL